MYIWQKDCSTKELCVETKCCVKIMFGNQFESAGQFGGVSDDPENG